MKPAFGCLNNTIKLRSGLYFDLADPQPDQFELSDIACGLSKICRFGGQVRRFYSVAEHSLLCADVATVDGHAEEVVRAVLMHDAAEAFIGDVVKPLKAILPDYLSVEARVEAAIAARFGIDFEPHEAIIGEIDHAVLIAERRELFEPDGRVWAGENEVRRLSPGLLFMDSETVETLFLQEAERLGIE